MSGKSGLSTAGDVRRDLAGRWERILQELRVTQTGTQIISGFLLSVAFQPTFAKLPAHAHVIYLVLVVLACSTSLLGLLPVVQHRRRMDKRPSERLVTMGSRVLVVLLVLVTVLAIGVAVFIFDAAVGVTAAIIAAGCGLAAGLMIWVLPIDRGRREHRLRP